MRDRNFILVSDDTINKAVRSHNRRRDKPKKMFFATDLNLLINLLVRDPRQIFDVVMIDNSHISDSHFDYFIKHFSNHVQPIINYAPLIIVMKKVIHPHTKQILFN